MLTHAEMLNNFTIVDMALLRSGRIAACALFDPAWDDGVPIAIMLYGNEHGEWERGLNFHLEPMSVVECYEESGETWLLGREGEIICGDAVKEFVGVDVDPPGPFRRIYSTELGTYILGEDRTLWRRYSGGWKRLGPAPRAPSFDDTTEEEGVLDRIIEETQIGFGVAVRSASEISVVGSGGMIRFWNGEQWSDEDSPTNMNLLDVCVNEKGEYIVVGQRGTVVVGSPGQWALTLSDDEFGDLLSVCWFCGDCYTADRTGLFRVTSGQLEPVLLPGERETPIRRLVANDSRIVAFAAKEVWMSLDGATWKSIL